MIYGTSKVITEHITLGETYAKIKKVYSVNVVYFDLGQGDDYVYHGKTDFKGIHNRDNLILSDKQVELLGGKTEPNQLFPEYYVLKVNQFDNVAKDNLDEWIYYLKNGDIKPEFKAKGINGARELWRVDKLSDEEQKQYFRHIEDLRYEASMAWTMKVEAEDRIRDDERIKAKKTIALELKRNGVAIEVIIKSTGLSQEEIDQLK